MALDAVIERTLWIGEPAPAARRFKPEGVTDDPCYRGVGGDAFLERGDA